MADFEKVEFEFPDEIEAKGKPEEPVEQEAKGKPDAEFEIEIEDDIPKETRQKRPPMPAEEVEKLRLEVDELDNYSEEAKVKLIKMKKVWNDERRAKESAERERQEAINLTQRLHEENKRIKEMLSNGEKEYVGAMKNSADMQLEIARKAYKEAYDSGDAEKVMEAQQLMTEAALRLDKVKNFKMPPLQEEKFEVKREEQYQPPPKPDARVMAWQ